LNINPKNLIMKNIIYLLSLCSSLVLLGQNDQSTYNAATGWKSSAATTQATDQRQVGAFEGISVSGPFYVTLKKGTPGTVAIDASSKILEDIVTKVEDGQLIIKFKNHKVNRRINSKISIEVPINSVHSVKLSGSGKIQSNFEIESKNFSTALSGSGSIAIEVAAAKVSGKLSGSGKIELEGKTEQANFQLAGSGKIEASPLVAQEAHIKLSGSGRVHVHADKRVDSKISGSGRVKYKSNTKEPQVYSMVNGSGGVSRM
jgi:hypothetical protein